MEAGLIPIHQVFESNIIKIKPLIIVISSEEESLLVYKNLLDIWGYSVETYKDSENLLLINTPRTPHCILVELEFPVEISIKKISELKLLFKLKETPILTISSFSQTEYRNMALSNGANDYLVKPLDYDHLKNSLNVISQNFCPSL